MDSQSVVEMDYRSRFKDFLAVEEQRKELVEVCYQQLPATRLFLIIAVGDPSEARRCSGTA